MLRWYITKGMAAENHQITGATGITSIAGYNSTIVPGLAASGYGSAEYGALHASAFARNDRTGAG
jgi:hypothetical protein